MKPVRLPLRLEERILREKDDAIKFSLFQEHADKAVKKGEFESAFQLYERAFEVARNMHNLKMECATLIDLGSVADKLGQTEFAFKRFNDALQIARETQDLKMQNTINGKLAILSIKMHRPELAVTYFEQATEALDIANSTRVKDKEQETNITSHRSKRRPKASPVTRRATELSNEIEQEKHARIVLRRIILVADALLIFAIASIINHIVSSSSISGPGYIALIALIVVLLVFIGALMLLTRIFFSSVHED